MDLQFEIRKLTRIAVLDGLKGGTKQIVSAKPSSISVRNHGLQLGYIQLYDKTK